MSKNGGRKAGGFNASTFMFGDEVDPELHGAAEALGMSDNIFGTSFKGLGSRTYRPSLL